MKGNEKVSKKSSRLYRSHVWYYYTNGTLNSLHGMIGTENNTEWFAQNDSNGSNAFSKSAFRKLLVYFLIVIILQTLGKLC
jgi:hypothetical protein